MSTKNTQNMIIIISINTNKQIKKSQNTKDENMTNKKNNIFSMHKCFCHLMNNNDNNNNNKM